MTPIKLYLLGTLDNCTQRLQSQLLIGSSDADFVLKNGILYHWGHNKNGFGWYEYNHNYIIITDKQQMEVQAL